MKSKGFTLIELMIVIAIIGILAAVAIQAYQCKVNGKCDATSMTCVGGYKFSANGQQVFSENGGGVPCAISNGSVTNVTVQ